MINMFVLVILYGAASGASVDHIAFPHRAECDYAAKKITEEVQGAKAFCFDVQVAGDRHEGDSGLSLQ